MIKETGIYYSNSDVCGGHSPWKSTSEVTKATLDLARRGINVAGLSDKDVIRLYQENRPNSGDSLTAATPTPKGTPTF